MAAVVLVAIAVALAGCRPGVQGGNPADSAPLANQASSGGGSLEVVAAGPPVRKTLKFVTTQPARIEPIEQTPIQSKIAAYVAEVAVDYGDKVTKGQPLMLLAAPELEAELAQKHALLERSKAELAQAESGVRAAQAGAATAQSRVAQAEAAIERTEAETHLRQLEFERLEGLAAGGSINRQLVDETQQKLSAAQASATEARAAIQSAKAGVVEAKAQVAKAEADVLTAKSSVRVAAANVQQVEAMRSYLSIKSPFDGVVTLRRVDPGHLVQPASASATPLLTVARIDKMRVTIAVPEIEAAYVDVGDDVAIEVQSLRGAEITGKITRTSLALEAGSRALEAMIDLDNTDGRLRPGMYATARLTLQEQKDVLTLPSAAVVREGREAFCYRLADGKAAKTPIQLGIRVGSDFEITSGIAADDQVILNKASSLKDGQPVEASQPPAG